MFRPRILILSLLALAAGLLAGLAPGPGGGLGAATARGSAPARMAGCSGYSGSATTTQTTSSTATQTTSSTTTQTTSSTTPTYSAPGPPPPDVQPATPSGHPVNDQVAINCEAGTIRVRSDVQVGFAHGHKVSPFNQAFAEAHDCSANCLAVAVAMQVALVDRNARVQTPQNLSEAINLRCHRCGSFAFAYQDVEQVSPGTRLPHDTRMQIEAIDRQVSEDIDGASSFPGLDQQLRALAQRLRAVVQEGLSDQRAEHHHLHDSEHQRSAGSKG